jgi:hypothetical protein
MCIIKLKSEDKSWPFIVNKDGTFYLTDRGALVKLDKVAHWGFNKKYDFGTGRGYIWSRTFPLMVSTILLGHGADTFTMYFPQNDFIGIYYDYGHHSESTPIFDKPHNFVLLNWVNTGGISAIALLAIIVIYLIQSYRLYSCNIKHNIFSSFGAGCYLGIVAFLFAGVAYDTSVNIMPLIYGVLGIGISCNYYVKGSATKHTFGFSKTIPIKWFKRMVLTQPENSIKIETGYTPTPYRGYEEEFA